MKKLLIVILAALLLGGCTNPNTGSRTVVGDHMALPELSDSADSVSLRVYESVKGAKVWTAKDCNVVINYTNAYTNTYFGVVESRDSMTLSVEIEPCESAADTQTCTTGSVEFVDGSCNPVN